MDNDLFLRGLIAGPSIAATVGPIRILCVQGAPDRSVVALATFFIEG